jgi:hypothetical protein
VSEFAGVSRVCCRGNRYAARWLEWAERVQKLAVDGGSRSGVRSSRKGVGDECQIIEQSTSGSV